jgi:hypothetical protein
MSNFRQDSSVDLLKDFTPYPRWVLRSGKLSLEGTSVYLWFISHERGFTITKAHLLRSFPKLGESRYRTVMAELESRDLLRRERTRRTDGTRGPMDWCIRVPSPEEVEAWE